VQPGRDVFLQTLERLSAGPIYVLNDQMVHTEQH